MKPFIGIIICISYFASVLCSESSTFDPNVSNFISRQQYYWYNYLQWIAILFGTITYIQQITILFGTISYLQQIAILFGTISYLQQTAILFGTISYLQQIAILFGTSYLQQTAMLFGTIAFFSIWQYYCCYFEQQYNFFLQLITITIGAIFSREQNMHIIML